MTGNEHEITELTNLLCSSVAATLNKYATGHPATSLSVEEVRQILVKIIDYLDIAEISGFGPWKK